EELPLEAGPLLLARAEPGALGLAVGARRDVEGAAGDHHPLRAIEEFVDRRAVRRHEGQAPSLEHGIGVGTLEKEPRALAIGREEDGGSHHDRPAWKAATRARALSAMAAVPPSRPSAAEPTAAAAAPVAATWPMFSSPMPAMATTGTGERRTTSFSASRPRGAAATTLPEAG